MKTKDTLKKAIENIPIEQCPDGVWNKIEMHLNKDNEFQTVIQELPIYHCPDNVWEEISDTLDKKPRHKVVKLWTIRSIAASIALILVCIFYLVKSPEKYSLSFYEEDNIQPKINRFDKIAEVEDQEALQLIQNYCKTAVELCNSSEYKFYLDEFKKLDADMSELETLMKRDPERTELLEAEVQLENAKSEIIKNMAKLFVQ